MSKPLLDPTNAPPLWAQWMFGIAGLVAVLFLIVPWTRDQVRLLPKRIWWIWSLLPFSRTQRYRRAKRDLSVAEAQLRQRVQVVSGQEHFDARRAVPTIYEDVVDPRPWKRDFWIHDEILGYGTSGNLAIVKATSVDDPEVVDIINRFEALKTSAAAWPETLRWKAAAKRVESLKQD